MADGVECPYEAKHECESRHGYWTYKGHPDCSCVCASHGPSDCEKQGKAFDYSKCECKEKRECLPPYNHHDPGPCTLRLYATLTTKPSTRARTSGPNAPSTAGAATIDVNALLLRTNLARTGSRL